LEIEPELKSVFRVEILTTGLLTEMTYKPELNPPWEGKEELSFWK
jgi:hypothetical protein